MSWRSDEEFLWPEAQRKPDGSAGSAAEVVNTYPYRSDFPTARWWDLISAAQRQIDLLGFTLYFLPM